MIFINPISRVVLGVLLLGRTLAAADFFESLENFNSLTPGSVNGQNGWSSPKNDASIEDTSAIGGEGRSLSLKPKFSTADKNLSKEGLTGTVHVFFKLRLATTDCKVLVILKDTSGKNVSLLSRDLGKKWLIGSAGRYLSAEDKTAPATWLPIHLALDFSTKKFSVRIDAETGATLLFKDRDFRDVTAQNLSSISFQRIGVGDDEAIHIDDLVITTKPVESKTESSVPKKNPDSFHFETPTKARHSIFDFGETPEFVFYLKREKASADTIDWQVQNFSGKEIAAGTIAVPDTQDFSSPAVKLPALPAGYYAVFARLKSSGLKISRAGSRPEGFGTFGILPDLVTLPLSAPDEARFGMQGTAFVKSGTWMTGDPYDPLYRFLGARWIHPGRQWSKLEPEKPGTFSPKLDWTQSEGGEASFEPGNGLVPLYHVDGLPQWAIDWPDSIPKPKGKMNDQSYAPKDFSQYENFLGKVAQELAARRTALFQKQKNNYYQIHWEPDWHYKGSDEAFVKMYESAHRAIHLNDPNAVVLATGGGVLSNTVATLTRLFTLGLAKSVDGISTHAYYVPFGNPNASSAEGRLIPPEEGGNIENLRKLRTLMKTHLKPEARLFQTEWGLDYRSRYVELDPALLKIHAAFIIRGHILCLGEGCDATFFFYTGDYGNLETRGENGYGLTFNLTLPKPSFGPIQVSPKPVFMAGAALTRILEGTKTIGPVVAPAGVYAYLFQRGDENVLAFWATKSSPEISLSVGNEVVTLYDFMGNHQKIQPANGKISIQPTEYPNYLITKNAIPHF